MLKQGSIFLSIAVVVTVVFAGIAYAKIDPLSSDLEQVVKNTCVNAQVSLQRIQQNDAATRVNRGQAYENLLSHYITPLNSRAAGEGYSEEASKLSEITSRYQKAVKSFKKNYELYDDAVIAAVHAKCQEKPEIFYDYLRQAKEQRVKLAADVSLLDALMEEYRMQAVALKGRVQ